MTEFRKASYNAQVRRLRALAEKALQHYSVGSYELKFITHGENTTFKVVTRQQNYLLRVHRTGYHSLPGLKEELQWLKKLSQKNEVQVQRPILSKSGQIIVTENAPGVDEPRHCDLMSWCEGHRRYNSLTPHDLFYVGVLTGQLHNSSRNSKIKHRNYWTIEGMVGERPKFGDLKAFHSNLGSKSKIYERCRHKVLRELRQYKKTNGHKSGLIHADIHFGNLIWNGNQLMPIDFDDCGFGYFMYDLAVTLYSAIRGKNASPKRAQALREGLFLGYATQCDLDEKDVDIVDSFIMARRLSLILWLHERCDNPLLRKYFKKALPKTLKAFAAY